MYQKGQFIIYGVRGVCEVMDITSMERPGEKEERLYYVLRPYYQKGSKIVAPVDSEKTVTRLLISREEAEALLEGIHEVPQMQVANDKLREERYKEAVKTCDCRAWISLLKMLYMRRQARLRQGKRLTDLDERYFRSIQDTLCSELALSLGVPREEMAGFIRSRVGQAEG